ncbi:phosphotransferase [Methanolobus sp.]|uniref:phosphotransferase n=1 Tax=Methanolobus sp. TaxID=1874737 RepID=UPI0025EC786D|nr:phosphotransferase [Methanolobus sp.]
MKYYVNTLYPGDPFRDWLVGLLGNRIQNKSCVVDVFKYDPSSHTVCRYKFRGEKYSVVAKFFAEPHGKMKKYNAYEAMDNEYNNLKKVGQFINVARPIATNRDFNCVLVTEYISGKSLFRYMENERNLYDRLTSVAYMLRRLHDSTEGYYDREREFANFHHVLDQLRLDPSTRQVFNELLGKWWHSSLLDRYCGCMVHRDATPSNYIFRKSVPYALDFESSWENGNAVRDLGILCSELNNYYKVNKGSGTNAEPYIGHFLWHYSRNEEDFHYITQVLPFFMSLGLLRSARLHRRYPHYNYLIKEAIACLKALI